MDKLKRIRRQNSSDRQLDLFTDEDFYREEVQSVTMEFQQTQHETLFKRLKQSTFRSSFHLSTKDVAYIQNKGLETIRMHAVNLIDKRLSPANLPNDGKQTPMRGHPVFIAQHATGCCCRKCLYKWHHISPDHNLCKEEKEYVVDVLMDWIARDFETKC